jgi:hypothetical protein
MTTEADDANARAYQAWLATPDGQAAVNATQPVAPAAPAATTIGGAPAPAAPAAPEAQPAAIDYAALAAEIVKAGGVPTAAAPAPVEAKPPSPVNLFAKGNLVVHEWNDPYDGPSKRMGIVVDTTPDEGSGASSSVAWLDGPSGPIGDQNLSAV